MTTLTELKITCEALTAKIISNDIFLVNALINEQQDDDRISDIERQQIFLKRAKRQIQRYIKLLDN